MITTQPPLHHALLARLSMQKTFFQPKFALNAIIVILIISRWVNIVNIVILIYYEQVGCPAGLGRADHPEQGSLGEPEQGSLGEPGEDDLLIKLFASDLFIFLFAIHPSSTFMRTISLYVCSMILNIVPQFSKTLKDKHCLEGSWGPYFEF